MNTRIRALARALSSLLLLAVLEIGAPWGLLAFGTLPHHLPTLTQTGTALTSPDTGALLIGAITLIGWLAWIAFTFAVVVETLAALRHRGAPRVRTLGAIQQLAAGLVASIIVLLPATGAALAASSPPAAAATLHLPHAGTLTATEASQQAAARGTSAQSRWHGPVHHVTSNDESMWDLAQHYLGDGMRWKEIAQLNQGVPQPDGATVTAATLQLTPGWTLRLPTDARTTSPAPEHAEPAAATHSLPAHQRSAETPAASSRSHSETVHVVRPGDTLSQIAQDDLGDANDYPKIAAANKDVVQSDGRHLTDPNLIYPGWQLTIPQASPVSGEAGHPTGGTTAPAGTTGSAANGTGAGGGTAANPHPSAAPTRPTASAPATSAPSTPTTSPTATSDAAPGTGQSSTAVTHTAAPTAPPTLTAVPTAPTRTPQASSAVEVGAGIAALLAAGLLGGYSVKRALQQRNRRPGETIAVPAQTSALEHALVHQAEPPTAELLDRALRTLVHLLPPNTPLPQLAGARLTPDTIQLHADGPPLAPFTSGPDGWWQLDPTQQLLNAEEADKVQAPYPLLATLGTQPDQGLLLADLATRRTVLLNGPREQVREVARALALEATTCPWGRDLSVLCAGITDPDLPAIVHTGRLQHLARLGDAVTDLAGMLLTAHQDTDAPPPWLLVVADHASEQDAWQLADLMARVPDAPIALVLPGQGLHALFPDALQLDCASTDPQPGPIPDAPLVLQRITDPAYQQLLADLRTTEQPAVPAQGAWEHVPDSPDHLAAGPDQDLEPERGAAPGPEEGDSDGRDGVVTPFLAFTQQRSAAAQGAPTSVPLLPPTHGGITVQINEEPNPDTVMSQEPADQAQVLLPGTEGQLPQQATGTTGPALDAPEIRVLGPLDVTGLGSSGRGRRVADLAAYLYLHPGRTAEAIAAAMNPVEPWEHRTVVSRMSDLRKLLGTAPDGTPYLPRVARNATYPQLNGVRCDWTAFLALAEDGLAAGAEGTTALEAALTLVRGRPFQGSTASWAMPEQQEMVSRITDVAHATAVQRIATHNWGAARAAIATGLDVEPTAEILFRDWITLEHRAGNRTELGRVVSELQRALRPLDVEMEHATEKLITDIYESEQHRTRSA
jgi:nucleoid-associated protein YgaU